MNCLVNTDFYQSWSVVIEKYPDKIVMENPGTIITGKKQMLKGGISQPINKGMFKMFNLIGLGEHAGSGVPDIFHAWKEVGLEDPVVEERFGNPDRTTMTLPLTSSQGTGLITTPFTGEGVSEGAKTKVLQFCEMPRTKNEIQEHLGIRSDRYIRQRVIQPLLSDGRLARTIPEKPSSPKQKYIATESEMERPGKFRDSMGSVATIHVPYKKSLIEAALNDDKFTGFIWIISQGNNIFALSSLQLI